MSVPRFLGWEPAETHTTTTTHPDGSVTTSSTVVHREPEWNETSRRRAYDLYDDLKDRCPDCGQPRDVCADPEVAYYNQRTTCWASAARDVARRRWGWMQKNAKHDQYGYLPDDGVSVWVAPFDLNPDDDFLKNAPVKPPD